MVDHNSDDDGAESVKTKGETAHNAFEDLRGEAIKAMEMALSRTALYDCKVQYLGKQGKVSLLMREMGQLPKEDRPQFGQKVNQLKSELELVYESFEQKLLAKELEAQISRESLDLSLSGPSRSVGGIHPITKVIREVTDIMARIGYAVRTGPCIETDFNNFEALNIPEDHPSREMQDTFYLEDGRVLRTHTSPIQIRSMLSEKPPLRIVAPGPVFRCDSDISHSPNFHQIEGLLVDRKVSMADLKGTISFLLRELMGSQVEVRFRPSFFPFTEPSAEFDCSCPICSGKGCRMCKGSGWIEIGGCGLVNPKVFEKVGLDHNEWQGFAFGFGIERMAIILYGVGNIKLFSDNDLRFLEQFTS